MQSTPPGPTAGTPVLAFEGARPTVADGAWVAPGAMLVGDVHLGAGASVWYGAVLRGDGDTITIGAESNVQDGCVVHADPGRPVRVAERVTVGHRAVLHGCTVEEGSLIGMGSVLLNGVHVGAGSMVAAGAVVLEGTVVPAGSLVAGVPARVRRELTAEERERLRTSAATYVDLARRHGASSATASSFTTSSPTASSPTASSPTVEENRR
jgi:carbonic anhydrase/acetyltransferase-like protein (isoleucine patch superfamily)